MQTPSSCTLDEAAVLEQKFRYDRLARSATRVQRHPDTLLIEFDRGLDLDTLEQVIAVERECCPFFGFAFDPERRQLRVTVDDEAMVPALDAISDAFG